MGHAERCCRSGHGPRRLLRLAPPVLRETAGNAAVWLTYLDPDAPLTLSTDRVELELSAGELSIVASPVDPPGSPITATATTHNGWAGFLETVIEAPAAIYGSACDGAPDEPLQDVDQRIALVDRGECTSSRSSRTHSGRVRWPWS